MSTSVMSPSPLVAWMVRFLAVWEPQAHRGMNHENAIADYLAKVGPPPIADSEALEVVRREDEAQASAIQAITLIAKGEKARADAAERERDEARSELAAIVEIVGILREDFEEHAKWESARASDTRRFVKTDGERATVEADKHAYAAVIIRCLLAGNTTLQACRKPLPSEKVFARLSALETTARARDEQIAERARAEVLRQWREMLGFTPDDEAAVITERMRALLDNVRSRDEAIATARAEGHAAGVAEERERAARVCKEVEDREAGLMQENRYDADEWVHKAASDAAEECAARIRGAGKDGTWCPACKMAHAPYQSTKEPT